MADTVLTNKDGVEVFRGTSPGSQALLGPFAVAFNTPNLDTGVNLTTIDDGAFVMQAWAVIQTAWSLDGAVTGRYLQFAVDDGLGFSLPVHQTWCDENNAGGWSGLPMAGDFPRDSGDTTTPPILAQQVGLNLTCVLTSIGGNDAASEGAADVYMVVATAP